MNPKRVKDFHSKISQKPTIKHENILDNIVIIYIHTTNN